MTIIHLRALLLDSDAITNVFNKSQLEPGDRAETSETITVTVEAVEKQPGMGAAELLVSMAVSFGTGVPAGIAANWIWRELSRAGANPVLEKNGSKEAVTLEQIERLVAKLVEQSDSGELKP